MKFSMWDFCKNLEVVFQLLAKQNKTAATEQRALALPYKAAEAMLQ